MSYFSKINASVALSLASVGPSGLREAQVGALMALAGHFTCSSTPAQIILPTGVGKTTVAMLSPYMLGARRVLVVVPGRLIRGQVEAEFREPTRALEAGIIPANQVPPCVAVAEPPASAEDGHDWESVDVVVGTPHVLSPLRAGVEPMPGRDFFDLIIFDEAHHLPATTWRGLLESTDAQAVLLTATPFRNDGQRLPGEVVYSYPLRRAIARGVFGEVRYLPIDRVRGQNLDVTIAQAAANRLASADHQGAGSRLLVRSDTVEHAKELVGVYGRVGVPLGLVVHTTPYSRAKAMREQVERGDLKGFVCVGALTEGFDFPALKIGAYHVPHRTLAPTLQFIGRLSRRGEIAGELLAPRDAVTDETASLYREDQAWRDLLPDLLDSAVDHERDVRRFIAETEVEGGLDISPLSILPSRSVQIYLTDEPPSEAVDLEQIAGSPVVKRFFHADSQTLAFVTRRVHRPRFMRLDVLDVPIYELHLVTWVERHGVLFVATPTEPGRRDLLAATSPSPRRPLSGDELRRLLDAARMDRFFSIGMRAARAQGSRTSYEMRAGSKTEDDLTPADARGWDLGHGMGRSGNGTGTFGFSVAKSKIWEPGAADSLFGFRRWCERQAAELARADRVRAPSKLDLLGMSEPLDTFPENPVLGVLPSAFFSHGLGVEVDGEEVLPELLELHADPGLSGPSQLTLTVKLDGEARAQLVCELDGSVSATGAELCVVNPDDGASGDLAEYLTAEPPTIFFASGVRVVGDRIAQRPPVMPRVSDALRRPRGWQDVAITVEFGDAPRGSVGVGGATASLLADELPIVVQDHLRGEIADFIGIDTTRLTPEIRLVHCKSSASVDPAARLGDLQELVAQSIRSVQWLASGADLWRELRRRILERDATKILKGEQDEIVELLDAWSTKSPTPDWSIWMVQPGVSDAALDGSETVSSLLNAAHSWIESQNVELALICSP